MKFGIVPVVLSAAMISIASSAASSFGWRLVGKASASGQFAVAAANGSAKHPRSLAVRITGGGAHVSGFAAVACSKGIGSIGSTSTSYHSHFALLKLPMKNPDSCDVTASASGSGHLKLEILAR